MKFLLSAILTLPLLAHAESDSFQKFLAARAAHQRKLSSSIHQWVGLVETSAFTKALETAPSRESTASFKNEAIATKLYLLWKQELNRTFFDQWLKSISDANYASSDAEKALEAFLTPEMDSRLLKSGVILNADQRPEVSRLSNAHPIFVTMRVWIHLRDEKSADELLKVLNPNSRLVRYLTNAVVYGHVRHGDWQGAARILDTVVAPRIAASRDLEALAAFDLAKARILYQAGKLPAAASYYSKIPNQSPYYLQAREELSWVYLRQNDSARLRGELAALASPVFRDRFQPEVYLLRSISDLKMCFYDQLEADIVDFQNGNAAWARKIDQALTKGEPLPPAKPDEFTLASDQWLRSLQLEKRTLENLRSTSRSPANAFWSQNLSAMASDLAAAKTALNENYLRQWKNQRAELREAIRKMRFVKVEYMNQLRPANVASRGNKTLVASNGDGRSVLGGEKDDSKRWVFPVSSEIWPDEWFHLRSAARAQCQKKSGAM